MSRTDSPTACADPAEVAEFERHLRAGFGAAARGIQLPATAGAAVVAGAGRHRHRWGGRSAPRRRWVLAGVTVAVAVALVAAGVTALPRVLRDDDRVSVVAAGGARGVRATVYGVSLGWLPDGVISQRGDYARTSQDFPYRQWWVYQAGFSRPETGEGTQDPRETVTVTVTRSGDGDRLRSLEELRRSVEAGPPSSVVTSTTVGPRPALLAAYPENGWYLVYWVVDGPGGDRTSVEVLGADQATVLRIARAAVVGPPPGPADRPAAVDQIRAAARAAFDSPAGTKALAAVADGARLRPALEKALAADPDGARNVRSAEFDDADVVFLNDTEAAVRRPVITTPGDEETGQLDEAARFVDTADGWKITAVSYCHALARVWSSTACGTG
ncbi:MULTISPECIES: hypothetical protein [Pseudofrankia]|uniref:hypothetical protein n=1 Tax=Pseudofrankia TaxID=2994363 RepID=UPI000234D706|nr:MULTISPECIES: hypothetical protein [Pseudofrankia]OHV36959.1 hypothetical protein BCD49_16970 [Pseudofrankia sp. EUN1h]